MPLSKSESQVLFGQTEKVWSKQGLIRTSPFCGQDSDMDYWLLTYLSDDSAYVEMRWSFDLNDISSRQE